MSAALAQATGGPTGGPSQNCNNNNPPPAPTGTGGDPKQIVQSNGQTCPSGGSCTAASGCGGGGCTGDFFTALGSAESNKSYSVCNSIGCCGWIQFCKGNLTAAINTCGGNKSDFSSDANGCQDKAVISYTQGNWNTLVAIGMQAYLCKTITIGGVQYKITQAGLLGASNLCGAGGTKKWIVSGINGTDMNGTSCARYFINFNSTSVPTATGWADTTCPVQNPACPLNNPPPPPPKHNSNSPCGDPALTNQFAQNPCGLAKPPAVKFPDYLKNWWNNSLLPALKDMTAQLYSYRIFETWELGRMMDATDATRAARASQEQRLASHQGVAPNESTCVAGSAMTALMQNQLTATQLTQGFIDDLERRAQGVAEGGAGTTPPASGSFGSGGYDIAQRWAEYCNEFFDPKSNDGINACPGNPTTAPSGGITNGDVNVESFLLQDTIDMNNPHDYAAAKAILINLIEPTIMPRVPQDVVNTTMGQEYIIRLQHLQAINNIAADVVGGIISRRAALPPTDASIAKQILNIREAVGIPACASSMPLGTECASNTPSYNEIMEAMTQERFYDPKYFTRVENNIGALKQEQASVDGYTTVQLQDIYQLQEQINALLAARAALKLKVQDNSNMSQSAPEQ